MPDEGLLGFVGNELKLGERMDDGSTLRDNLLSLWRQNQYRPADMPAEFAIDCPHELAYLWEYFRDMGVRRTEAGALSHSDVEAWARRYRIILDPFEHQIIDAMEAVYQAHAAKRLQAMRKK